jgi:methylmalonyl-CoA/ethylmalonyl-CoA epimerase
VGSSKSHSRYLAELKSGTPSNLCDFLNFRQFRWAVALLNVELCELKSLYSYIIQKQLNYVLRISFYLRQVWWKIFLQESNMSSQKNENFRLEEIGQIAVPVSDIDRAITFYRDIIGMRFLFQAPPGLGFFDCNGVRLLLDAPAKAQDKNYSSIIYYKVPDLQTAYTILLARGVVFEQKPELVAKMPDHELWMAFFRDPDSNLLALMSEVR